MLFELWGVISIVLTVGYFVAVLVVLLRILSTCKAIQHSLAGADRDRASSLVNSRHPDEL